MPIVGHGSKLVFGWAVGERPNTQLALQAWERAKQVLQRLPVPYAGMIMHHDRDPIYTGDRWTWQLLIKDELRLSYALRGAKDNPEMESFNGRFKTEGRSLFLEAQSLSELVEVVGQRMMHYNTVRRHSSIGYVAPLSYIEQMRPRVNKGR
jgi:transposase InsO family protein